MSLTSGLTSGLTRGLNRLGGGGVAAAWSPAALPGTPREWLADPLWCYTDGSAAFVAASSQSLSAASNGTLQTGDVDFWWAGWVLRADNAGQCFAAQDDDVLGRSWAVDISAGNYRFYTQGGSGGALALATQPSAGSFHFVLAWRDKANGTVNIRIDNGTTVTASTATIPLLSTGAFTLGARTYAGSEDYLNGNLSGVAWGKSPPGGIAGVISAISSRLYAAGNGITYADLTPAEKTDWGLVSWWDLIRSGNFTDSQGTNNLTNNNGVGFGAGLPRARCGDTDPIAAAVDRLQGTVVSQPDPLKRPTLRLVGGKWVMRFDGVNDCLFNSAYTSAETGGHSTGAAFVLSDAGFFPMLFVSRNSVRELRFVGGFVKLQVLVNGGGDSLTDPNPVTLGQSYRGIETHNFTSDSADLYRDGFAVASGSDTTSSTASGLCIGNREDGGTSPFGGDIYSLVYGEGVAWTPAEVALLDAYLGGLY